MRDNRRERGTGYYWVKKNGSWWIALYINSGRWLMFGNDNTTADDKVFDEIDERPILREEK